MHCHSFPKTKSLLGIWPISSVSSLLWPPMSFLFCLSSFTSCLMGYNGTRSKSSTCITPSLHLAACSISQSQEIVPFHYCWLHLICIRINYAATLPLFFCNTTVCWWALVVLNRVMLSLMPSCRLGSLPGSHRMNALNAEYSLCNRPTGALRGRHIQAPAAKAWGKKN